MTVAGDLLSYKSRSVHMLIERMVEKGIERDEAERTAQRLCEMGYLDDEHYAEQLSRQIAGRGMGVHRLTSQLRRDGVDSEIIDAVAQAFCADDRAIHRFIESKLKGQIPDRKLLKRISDGLYRRGFGFDEISAALRQYTRSEDDFEG